jgi:hypothetical protein
LSSAKLALALSKIPPRPRQLVLEVIEIPPRPRRPSSAKPALRLSSSPHLPRRRFVTIELTVPAFSLPKPAFEIIELPRDAIDRGVFFREAFRRAQLEQIREQRLDRRAMR